MKRKGKTQRICWPIRKETSLQQDTRIKAGSQKHTNIPISNIQRNRCSVVPFVRKSSQERHKSLTFYCMCVSQLILIPTLYVLVKQTFYKLKNFAGIKYLTLNGNCVVPKNNYKDFSYDLSPSLWNFLNLSTRYTPTLLETAIFFLHLLEIFILIYF